MQKQKFKNSSVSLINIIKFLIVFQVIFFVINCSANNYKDNKNFDIDALTKIKTKDQLTNLLGEPSAIEKDMNQNEILYYTFKDEREILTQMVSCSLYSCPDLPQQKSKIELEVHIKIQLINQKVENIQVKERIISHK